MCRMHPHHHGSGSLQTQSASVPLVIDQNPATGFDFLATPSCERFRPLFEPENEVIMHMQARSLLPHKFFSCPCTHRKSPCCEAKDDIERSRRKG